MSLALWLRTGRTERKLSLGDVARITKIQPRILERLEGGKLDGLPAEVFVRGFIRSFAKCCGLDETEALTRFSAASQAQAIATAPAMPGALAAPPTARAMVDAMSDLAPQIARTTSQKIEVVDVADAAEVAAAESPAAGSPAAGSPAAGSLAAGSLAAGSLAAGSLAAGSLAAGSLAAGSLAEGSLAAGSLAAGSLTGISTAVDAVAAGTAAAGTVAAGTAAAIAQPSKKKQRGKKRSKRATQQQQRMATGTPFRPTPVVVEAAVVEAAAVEAAAVEAMAVETAAVEAADVVATDVAARVDVAAHGDVAAAADIAAADVAAADVVAADVGAADVAAASGDAAPNAEPAIEVVEVAVVDHLDPLVEPADANEDIVATETWQPKMPAVTATTTVPWRRPYVATSLARLPAMGAVAPVPTLVIDDSDPDAAAQIVEDREAARSVLTYAQRRSFLPPILLDREDRGARQGGLTLAVIILLIAATLTLSYLMRRPSSSGDGVTLNAPETTLVG